MKLTKATALAAIFALALVGAACFDFFSPSCVGPECNATASKTENATPSVPATPTPTPIVTDSACVKGCVIESIQIDGNDVVVPLGGEITLQMSPFTKVFVCDATGKPTKEFDIVPTEKKCDDARKDRVQWSGSTSALTVLGAGFQATVKRVATGPVVVKVSLDGKSAERTFN